MSKHFSRAGLQSLEVQFPEQPTRNRAERAFDLHPILFAITIGSYFLFLAIMAAAFMTADLILPFVIFVVYVVMAFGTPAVWARMRGRDAGPVQSWAQFREEGVQIETGYLESGAAIAQILALPLLIVGWAVAIALLAALL